MPEEKEKKRPAGNRMSASAEEEAGMEVYNHGCPRVKLKKNKQKSMWDDTV